MKQDNKAKVDRRDLLRVLGVGAGAAIAPAALVPEAHADRRCARRAEPVLFSITISKCRWP